MLSSLDDLRAKTSPTGEIAVLGARLDDAAAGATLELAAGCYMTPVYVEKDLTLRGPSDGWAILVGTEGNPALEVTGEAREVVLERLVLRDVKSALGALAITAEGARVTLRECVLLDNASTANDPAAGGVTIASGELHCERCLFVGNEGPFGGALCVRRIAKLEATGCVFTENVSARGGGALYVDEASAAKLLHCSFVDDRSEDGGAGHTLQSRAGTGRYPDVTLINSVIRAQARCFGFSDDAPIVASGCALPEDAREYRELTASDCWFGEAQLHPFPFALVKDSPADTPGDLFRAGGTQTGFAGEPLEVDGKLTRGALLPR